MTEEWRDIEGYERLYAVSSGKRKTTGGFHWCFYQPTQLIGGKK